MKTLSKSVFIIIVIIILLNTVSYAEPEISLFGKTVTLQDSNNPNDYVFSLQLLILLTVLTLAPAILIMMTSFTRIIIVLSFIRSALGTQHTPPNQILIGLALFLTFFTMAPITSEVNDNALQPYLKEEINQEEAVERAMEPIREFMLRQTREKDLLLFVDIGGIEDVTEYNDIPNSALIPAFIISEIKTAFQIGFVLFIPFLIIDMVVASTLMSMGMMMLPPVMISLPFKILLFIMVDGWNLLIKALVVGFK